MSRTWITSLSLSLTLGLAACGGGAKPAPAEPAATEPAAGTEPAAAAPTECPPGEFMHEAGCVKECASDADCNGGICEQLHVMNDDGTIGPVSGNGCSTP
jgi:hypothetical protein